ncbi:MAG TPA: ribonuclease D [Actinomycetota bacterium]|jgi:ribonuclease D
MKLVTTTAELEGAVERLAGEPRIGIDTEFLREKTYHPRLCLIQVGSSEGIWLLDPLADLDLRPLSDVLASPSVQVVVHAGRQDLEIFHDQLDVVPKNVYDVQLAAGFAGYGSSLSYGRLVELALGETLVKGEAYTDWCQRPLTEAQLRYAADDVRYLLPLVDKIEGRLHELDRSEWAEEEMTALSDPASYELKLDDAWRKVAGRGSLSGRQAAMLREVARWREEAAVRRDLPRGWIVKDPTLVEIARRSPSSLEALKKIRGINSKEAERSARDILQAIERGRNAPPIATGAMPPRGAQVKARMISGLADAIVRSRCEAAGIATELVATRGELEALLADVVAGDPDERRHRLLHGWRRELAGDAVVALAEGRVGVRVIDGPPYVEEIVLDGKEPADIGSVDSLETAKGS